MNPETDDWFWSVDIIPQMVMLLLSTVLSIVFSSDKVKIIPTLMGFFFFVGTNICQSAVVCPATVTSPHSSHFHQMLSERRAVEGHQTSASGTRHPVLLYHSTWQWIQALKLIFLVHLNHKFVFSSIHYTNWIQDLRLHAWTNIFIFHTRQDSQKKCQEICNRETIYIVCKVRKY